VINVIEGRATKNTVSNPQIQCPEQKQKVAKNIGRNIKSTKPKNIESIIK